MYGGGGHVWQGCVWQGVCGREVCMVGACMVVEACMRGAGRVCVVEECVLMGERHGGGTMCGGGVMREGEMATEAGGTHLT